MTVSQENPVTLSIIVPVLDEETNIGPLLEKTRSIICDELGLTYEFIFVDDGSTDRSWDTICHLHEEDPQVLGLRFSRNFGHQKALKAGFDVARGDAVITIDCDFQHPPELIKEMVKKWRDGFEVVNTVKTDNSGQGAVKKFATRVGYQFLNVFSETHVETGVADFRLLDRKVVDYLKQFREKHLLLRSVVGWFGFQSTSINYVATKRLSGQSKYNIRRLIYLLSAGLLTSSVKPLRFATYFGMIITILSIGYSFYVIWLKLFKGIDIPGWTTTVVIELFLGGSILIVLGIIGEYIALIYEEIKGRPNYILRDRLP
jgi:dolichol-phosphate mannosyltransferase